MLSSSTRPSSAREKCALGFGRLRGGSTRVSDFIGFASAIVRRKSSSSSLLTAVYPNGYGKRRLLSIVSASQTAKRRRYSSTQQ